MAMNKGGRHTPPKSRSALKEQPAVVANLEEGLFPLTVISEPREGTRSVIVFTPDSPDDDDPVMQGDVPRSSFICGQCGRVLLKDIGITQVRNIVFRCPRCGAFNETLM